MQMDSLDIVCAAHICTRARSCWLLATPAMQVWNYIVASLVKHTDQPTISLELVAMVFDFTLPLLRPGGAFVTKIFQGTGIEGIVNAAKQRFSRVQRFSPEASRNSSSEVFLVCKNKLPQPKKESRRTSVMQELDIHLENEGIIQPKGNEPEEEIKSGFRRVPKKK